MSRPTASAVSARVSTRRPAAARDVARHSAMVSRSPNEGDQLFRRPLKFGIDSGRERVDSGRSVRTGSMLSDLPIAGDEDGIVDQPPGPVGASATAGSMSSGCGSPLSMRAITSGAFENGLSMANYYPDLAGSGVWQHGSSAGTWDTGSRAGANVQLIGTVPSPCRPENFSLKQSVTYTRLRFDGVADPREGVLQDDIAKSGRDFSVPPARQTWLGGGLNVSMADPPSIPYAPGSNIEFDRSFNTSLAAAGGGAKSVHWSTSIRVQNGRVTQNTFA